MPVSQKLPHGIAEVSTVSVLIRCWLKYQSVNARNVTPLYTLVPFLVHAWEAALQPILTDVRSTERQEWFDDNQAASIVQPHSNHVKMSIMLTPLTTFPHLLKTWAPCQSAYTCALGVNTGSV